MKINQKSASKLPKLPLPLYKSVKIGEAVGQDGEEFSIFVGLDKKLVTELKKLSLDKKDKELQKNTGDKKRFGDGTYKDWYKKSRTPFALVHSKTNTLAALVWFGPKSLGQKSIQYLRAKELKKDKIKLGSANWHTISYRTYPNFRGKGIAKKFTAFCVDVYMNKFPNIRLWAGINTQNIASKKLAESLGFKTLEKLSDREAHWLVMVKY